MKSSRLERVKSIQQYITSKEKQLRHSHTSSSFNFLNCRTGRGPPAVTEEQWLRSSSAVTKESDVLNIETLILLEAAYRRQRGRSIEFTTLERHEAVLNDFRQASFRNVHHRCSSSCTFDTLPPNIQYNFHGISIVATGDVCLCRESKFIHFCGPTHCTSYMIDSRGEGNICQLTGRWIAREYSTLTPWDDDENGRPASALVENPSYQSCKEDEGEGHRTLIEKMDSIAGYRDVDVIKTLQRYNTFPQEEILLRLRDRVFRRELTAERLGMRIHYNLYAEEYHKRIKHAEEEINRHLTTYYNTCKNSKIQPSFIQVYQISMIKGFSHLKNIPPFLNERIVQYNKTHFDYFVECALVFWERYESLAAEINSQKKTNIKFENCVVPILIALKQGFPVKVFTTPSCPKPRRWDKLSEEESKIAQEYNIDVIPRHTSLFFVSETDVYLRQTAHSQQSKGGSKKKRGGLSLWISNQPQRQRNILGTIPANKHLKWLVQHAIEASPTVEHFQKNYCLSYFFEQARKVAPITITRI
jgi:hypothetical protein